MDLLLPVDELDEEGPIVVLGGWRSLMSEAPIYMAFVKRIQCRQSGTKVYLECAYGEPICT